MHAVLDYNTSVLSYLLILVSYLLLKFFHNIFFHIKFIFDVTLKDNNLQCKLI